MAPTEIIAVGSLDSLYAVWSAPTRTLHQIMREHPAPPMDEIAGWEYDGANTGIGPVLIRSRKFRKGFYRGASRATSDLEPFIQGYNINVRQNGIDRPHEAKPSDEAPKRFGFYRVYSADQHPRHRRYPQALLLDYSLGGNGLSLPSLLRDYLVQVQPGSSDLLLGHAFLQLGPVTLPASFFVLSRARKHEFVGG